MSGRNPTDHIRKRPHQTFSDSLEKQHCVDSIADAFESAWRAWRNGDAKTRPQIDEFLAGIEDSGREALFRELLQVELALCTREQLDFPAEYYAKKLPEFAHGIAAQVHQLRLGDFDPQSEADGILRRRRPTRFAVLGSLAGTSFGYLLAELIVGHPWREEPARWSWQIEWLGIMLVGGIVGTYLADVLRRFMAESGAET